VSGQLEITSGYGVSNGNWFQTVYVGSTGNWLQTGYVGCTGNWLQTKSIYLQYQN